MTYQNVRNANGVLDWAFNDGTTIIKSIKDSGYYPNENEIIYLLTTGPTNIFVSKDRIAGSLNLGEGILDLPIGIDIASLLAEKQLPLQSTDLQIIEQTCNSALQSLRETAGITDIATIASIKGTTLTAEIILGVDTAIVANYVIDLWKFS
jgi:hypothetical protein